MLLNYHEMTMEQSKDDPAKKQQFMVICTVMVSVLAYSLMTSGAFVAIAPVAGVFPGGYFCYKFASLDYAASMGLGRLIQKDLLAEFPKDVEEAKKLEEKRLIEEMTYHLYLDDPTRMGGRRQRFMTGIMAGEAGIPKMNKLQAMNRGKTKKLTEAQKEDMSAQKYFETIPYEMVDLPSVDALVLQYPFTNGFVSALMFSYRVSGNGIDEYLLARRISRSDFREFGIPRLSPPCVKWRWRMLKRGIPPLLFPIVV